MKENRTTLIFYYLLSFHFSLINDHRNTFFQACTSIMFTLKDVPLNICIIRYLKLEFDFRPSNKTNLHTSETCKTSAASTDPYSSLVYPQFQKYQTFQMNPPTEYLSKQTHMYMSRFEPHMQDVCDICYLTIFGINEAIFNRI